jgi:hypothetical protein
LSSHPFRHAPIMLFTGPTGTGDFCTRSYFPQPFKTKPPRKNAWMRHGERFPRNTAIPEHQHVDVGGPRRKPFSPYAAQFSFCTLALGEQFFRGAVVFPRHDAIEEPLLFGANPHGLGFHKARNPGWLMQETRDQRYHFINIPPPPAHVCSEAQKNGSHQPKIDREQKSWQRISTNPKASALQAAHWGVHPVVIAVLEAIASGLASDYRLCFCSIGMEGLQAAHWGVHPVVIAVPAACCGVLQLSGSGLFTKAECLRDDRLKQRPEIDGFHRPVLCENRADLFFFTDCNDSESRRRKIQPYGAVDRFDGHGSDSFVEPFHV